MATDLGLIALLRSTIAGLDPGAAAGAENRPEDPAVSDLKRSVLRAVADLELHKAEAEKMGHATEIASVLARAGRAAYVVDPSSARHSLSTVPPPPSAEAEQAAHASRVLD